MATTSLIPAENHSTPDYLPPVNPKAVEQAMLIGDLSQMSDEQRIAYYVAVCRSMGLNALTRPFQALKGDDGKITLYPDKGCAEQLRKLHKVSTRVLSRDMIDGLYVVTVEARTPDGRTEEAQGVVPLVKAKGHWQEYDYHGQTRRRFVADVGSDGQEAMVPLSPAERATAMMRCETKAKRRATLAICGLGMPDYEGEPESPAHPMALTLTTPPPAEATKDLETHISDLFGDRPEGTTAVDAAMRQVDAAILANQGQVEPWYVWAERRFKKNRFDFTVDDWQALLSAVQAQSQKRAENGPEATTSHATAEPDTGDVPDADVAPEGSQTPLRRPETPEPTVWPNEDLGN